ncbi:hypothetical protein Tco_1532345 [Tanacetum coccineum]
MRHGFDLGYKTWVHHDEPDLPPPPPSIDDTRQPQMSDMTALLNDLSYIPPNNEHNEPTQGDIGETSNEPTQATRNEFEELYASANEELYLGCDYVTQLDFMAKFTYFKVKGLAADGFNPFGNLSQAYSMWPVILTTYNLPPWLCMKESSFMLTLLILGPKSLGKDIDVYLRPLIEDLKVLWDRKGVETIDDEILAQLDRLPTRVTGKHPSYRGVKIKRNVLVELNWTKRSIFYELEYWSFLTLRHNLDIMHIEKNVLEAILNTLLMNDKSKDTAKARQDLQRLGIQSGLWLGQTKNGKCLKPQYNGLQRLLPYGLQNYLPDKIAKLIIELCSLFKQISSATLIEDDMLKAQIKVVDILCDLELIYPHALFDIMIHLVIHLPLEALEGGPIRPRWMFPFERYMKKLKGYVRNKAKPEGSIAEGYVAEEALTFSSHYFWDVTTKFNHPDRNVDPPPPTCQFQVFRSVCKSIGLRSVIQFEPQEFMKVKLINIIDDEDALPHDLADSDDEDLINVDDDGVDKMLADIARSHGGDGGGGDRTPPHQVPTGCGGCLGNRGKGKRKPNLGGRAVGRLNTRDKTRNLSLKEITDKKGPVPIRFEVRDKQTLVPLGDHAAHRSSYIGEVIRGVRLYYPSWLKVSKERKAALITDIETQFDLRPHMESPNWIKVNAGTTTLKKRTIQQGAYFQGPALGL